MDEANRPRLKFHGKFRELIPAGFRFQKLFARNYRCYRWESGADDIIVWQHLGGYIEINDWYNHSYLIVNGILSGKTWTDGSNFNRFAIDQVEHRLEPYDFLKHETFKFHEWKPGKLGLNTKEERDTAYQIHCDHWRTGKLDQRMIDFVKEMANRGWVKEIG